MDSLFTREPETLDGYVPKFTLQEVLFHHKSELVQIGGGLGDMDFDPNNIQYETRHTIDVCGVELHSYERYGYKPAMEIVTGIINAFIADPHNEWKHPEAFVFIIENAEELNRSKRYWFAMEQRSRIEGKKAEIARLQEEVRREEWIASMRAVEVKSGRALTETEKRLLLAEFSGGEYQELS